jgi:SET domain-containing protein
MITKQSAILKKGGKVSGNVTKTITKKMSKVGMSKKETQKQALPDHHFKLVKVKRGLAGLGLFAGEDIKKGELIIEYIGNILTKEQVDAIKTNQYLFEVNRNKTIDGSVRWNTARYCNHACEEASNSESEIKKGRVFVKATKNIKEGEEIVYDYGEEFVNEYIAPHGCRCVAKEHSYNAKKTGSDTQNKE